MGSRLPTFASVVTLQYASRCGCATHPVAQSLPYLYPRPFAAVSRVTLRLGQCLFYLLLSHSTVVLVDPSFRGRPSLSFRVVVVNRQGSSLHTVYSGASQMLQSKWRSHISSLEPSPLAVGFPLPAVGRGRSSWPFRVRPRIPYVHKDTTCRTTCQVISEDFLKNFFGLTESPAGHMVSLPGRCR